MAEGLCQGFGGSGPPSRSVTGRAVSDADGRISPTDLSRSQIFHLLPIQYFPIRQSIAARSPGEPPARSHGNAFQMKQSRRFRSWLAGLTEKKFALVHLMPGVIASPRWWPSPQSVSVTPSPHQKPVDIRPAHVVPGLRSSRNRSSFPTNRG
jgi:hypothetical protein